jgi:hypothetical protein
MRSLQVALFVLALLLLLASLAFVGGVAGDALWRAGVAALLVDLVLIRLWPSAPATD